MHVPNNHIAVFAGSFDPITKGHESIVLRALPLFVEIHVMIGVNTAKKGMFPIEKRMEWIQETFRDYPNVKAVAFEGLTVDYCKKINAKHILRGIRSTSDFQYEQNIARINQTIDPTIETLFMLTHSEEIPISSSAVREILLLGGDVSKFVPPRVNQAISDAKNPI